LSDDKPSARDHPRLRSGFSAVTLARLALLGSCVRNAHGDHPSFRSGLPEDDEP